MIYIVYNKATTRVARKSNGSEYFATAAAAKRYVTRFLDPEHYAIADYDTYRASIEQQVERTNLMSGKKYMESINTPGYMSPASEAYWSM